MVAVGKNNGYRYFPYLEAAIQTLSCNILSLPVLFEREQPNMEIEHSHQPMERNLALELVRVTEAAAMAAPRYLGRGDKILVDEAAVAAMRYTLGYIQMDGIVVIGEGEKDHAPMLYIGERIGNGSDLKVDIAVDPIDGTTLVVRGLPGAISVVALASQGTMHCPMQCVYMNKIVTGPEAKDCIDINASVAENLKNIAKAKQREFAVPGSSTLSTN